MTLSKQQLIMNDLRKEYDKVAKEKANGIWKSKDDHFLTEHYYDTDFKDYYTYSFVLNGMLHHDIYHLGQLGIIIKYLKKNRKA